MTHHHRSHRRPGFTLIELLVVMGIIILIAASAIPAFRFITGSRSTDGAANVVNAMISRARSQALVDEQTYGVFFFLDPINDRSSMALVRQGGGGIGGGEYQAWVPGASYYDQATLSPPSTTTQLVQTREAVDGSSSNTVNPNSTATMKFAAISFSCIQAHSATGGAGGNAVTRVFPYGNNWWNLGNYGLEIVENTDFQVLPQGVGCQVMIDPRIVPAGSPATLEPRAGVDRYVRTGCILFDGQGRFTNTLYDVTASSRLGKALFLDQLAGGAANAARYSLANKAGRADQGLKLYSGFGVALYDRSAFLASIGPVSKKPATEGDYIFGGASTAAAYLPGPPYGPAPVDDKQAEIDEEGWIDANSLLLTATRYNGAMTRGE